MKKYFLKSVTFSLLSSITFYNVYADCPDLHLTCVWGKPVTINQSYKDDRMRCEPMTDNRVQSVYNAIQYCRNYGGIYAKDIPPYGPREKIDIFAPINNAANRR